MNARLWMAIALVVGGVGVSAGAQKGMPLSDGNSSNSTDPSGSFAQAFTVVQQFRDDITRIKRNGSPLSEGQVAYERMVGHMSVPTQLSHLPFPEEDTNRAWTVDAKRVAKGIKPKINYQVVNGETAIYFQGTSAIQQNLQDNVRIIAWYRDQMEKVCPSEQTAEGTYALARVIDAFLDKFADSVPQVTVRMDGTMNDPSDNRIEYSHREVWEMLAIVNRYFFYKVQIHDDEAKEYFPADALLMGSMVRTAAIYGASPPSGALSKIETRLEPDSPDWRGDAYEALNSWKEEQQKPQRYPQQLCTITIPQPKIDNVAVPAAPSFPPDVEDVKEIGGQIFIKRKGFWTLWNK